MSNHHTLEAFVPSANPVLISRAVSAASVVFARAGVNPLDACSAHHALCEVDSPSHGDEAAGGPSQAELANVWLDAEEAARSAVGGDEGRKTVLWVRGWLGSPAARMFVPLAALQLMVADAGKRCGLSHINIRVLGRDVPDETGGNWRIAMLGDLSAETDNTRYRALEADLRRIQASYNSVG